MAPPCPQVDVGGARGRQWLGSWVADDPASLRPNPADRAAEGTGCAPAVPRLSVRIDIMSIIGATLTSAPGRTRHHACSRADVSAGVLYVVDFVPWRSALPSSTTTGRWRSHTAAVRPAGWRTRWPRSSRAVELGYRYLETDVHATARRRPAGLPRRTLDRVTDRRGRGRPAALVGRCRRPGSAGSSRSRCWRTCSAPGLTSGSTSTSRRPPPSQPLVRPRRTGALDRVCVASFSHRRLAAVRAALGPRLCTSLEPPRRRSGCAPPRSAPAAHRLAPTARHAPSCRTGSGPLRGRHARRWCELAHARGQQVHVWTVDRAAEMHRLLGPGRRRPDDRRDGHAA